MRRKQSRAVDKPRRYALPVALWYWLLVAGGLAAYTSVRIDHASVTVPLWVGAIAGTLLGQALAVYNARPWVAFAAIIALPACAPALPAGLSGPHLWMTYVPAALCGFWSLGDRASLAAFWFPAMLWMLTILDRTAPGATPDAGGIAMLGALAVAFLGFLRVRESRRVKLWRTTGSAVLAAPIATEILEEPPGRPVARTVVAIALTAAAFAATAWLAPELWRTETFAGPHVTGPRLADGAGTPCCPLGWDRETRRARVAEYLDLGRGHDELDDDELAHSCRVCPPHGPDTFDDFGVASGIPSGGTPVAPGPVDPDTVAFGDNAGGWINDSDTIDRIPSALAPPAEPAPALETPVPQVAPPEPIRPQAASQTPTPPVADPAPVNKPLPTPPVRETAPPARPHAEPPSTAAAPSDVTTSGPPPPPKVSGSAVPLAWITAILAAALASQLLMLLLRPLRRAVTLRHLRRPLWDETVDQRVSNAWQLALIGLRDAGLRASRHESPGELARRVGVEGLGQCATILDRTRHGIGIDAGDIDEMTTSAETAYRTARRRVGPVARAIGWLRWPLA